MTFSLASNGVPSYSMMGFANIWVLRSSGPKGTSSSHRFLGNSLFDTRGKSLATQVWRTSRGSHPRRVLGIRAILQALLIYIHILPGPRTTFAHRHHNKSGSEPSVRSRGAAEDGHGKPGLKRCQPRRSGKRRKQTSISVVLSTCMP